MNELENCIRFGKVSSINAGDCTAKVTFSDRDNIVSYDLPVLQHGTGATKFYSMPSVGQTAVCLFLPFGIENGFVLGSFYDASNAPPAGSESVHIVKFKDGTTVSYDDAAGAVVIDCVGTVLIKGTGGITLDDNVQVTKNLTVANSITGGTQGGEMTMQGNINIIGSVTSTGDQVAGGISQINHKHGGVMSGGADTGAPK